jgi:hypothetical protein
MTLPVKFGNIYLVPICAHLRCGIVIGAIEVVNQFSNGASWRLVCLHGVHIVQIGNGDCVIPVPDPAFPSSPL